MAFGEGESCSNSSNSTPPWKYHVFLSFRGEDTRRGFTDHLYAALQRKGFFPFRDDEELDRGEVIKKELLKAIEESLSAIVILSRNYASSTWCLDELHKILESRSILDREVFPVFYGVDPSDVRHQRGSFAEAFTKHEERFREDKKKVQKWRDSLNEVANLSGWDCNNQSEAKLVEEIVELLWIKLRPKLPSYDDGLVGIDSRVHKLDLLLKIGLGDVRFIGIWGMGGIGKTTLARVIYERIHRQFEIRCFLANVREVSERSDGLVQLQRKLVSNFRQRSMVIDDLYDGKKTIRNLLYNQKVLLVLDDISAVSQLDNLAGNQEWFGPGSRVIVTTRDKHVLISHGVQFETYEIKILNTNDSLHLFRQKAFKSEQPQEDYLELSKDLVEYAGGLPLALKVLGSFLCGRTRSEWEDALDEMKQAPQNDILDRLRLSFNGLTDAQKTIFLDISCFFKGWDKNQVIQILKNCSLHPTIGINVLIEKSLVTCDIGGFLEMHDLLQEMGRNIVFQESPNDPGRRSRLWSLENIDQVLRKNKGTELVQGIVPESSTMPYEAHWDPEAFSKMCNVRILIILLDLQLPLGLKCLSNSLKVLEWKGYPLKSLPLGEQMDELVDLKMHHSKINQLWNETQFFGKLKFIDLSYSEDLLQTPIISGVPYLEKLILEGCVKLLKVHQSIGQHKKLVLLNLKDCINLKILPSKLEMSSLKHFILSSCSKITKLPAFGENMECLSMLDLNDCKNLVCLPNSICNLKSLKILNISGCSKFSRLPESLKGNEALEELDLSETAIREVNPCIAHLGNLKKLSFRGCRGRATKTWDLFLPFEWMFRRHSVMLPPILRLSSLVRLDLSYCDLSDASIPDDLGCLSLLCSLDLSGNNFVNLPAHCIANLSLLYNLSLCDCPRLQSLPVLPPNVQCLFATDCTQMKPFDSQKLWKLFESHKDQMKYWPRLWFIIPGSEIPPWFDNQSYLPLEMHDSHYDSIISITVDITDSCRSSKWWGFGVCLALEPLLPTRVKQADVKVTWTCRAPNAEAESSSLPLKGNNAYVIKQISYSHLFIIFLSDDHKHIQRHLRGDQNQLQLIFYAENAAKNGKLEISNCGWRVLCKEDVELWCKATSEAEMPFNSKDSITLNNSGIAEMTHDKRRRDEFKGEEAGTLNPEANLHPAQRRKLHQ